MFRAELICRTNSGIRAVRMTMVSRTIDRVQVHPEAGSMKVDSRVWNPVRMPETAQ